MRLATIWCAIVFCLWVTALGALRVHRSPNPLAAIFGLVQFIAGILIILLMATQNEPKVPIFL